MHMNLFITNPALDLTLTQLGAGLCIFDLMMKQFQ
jgi:hypothetical protein